MPKTRAQKEIELTKLSQSLSESKATVAAEFSGLLMSDLTSFRQKAGKQGVKFQIVKNTLLSKAAEEAGIKDWDVRKVNRQLAIATGGQDEVAVAKLVYEFAQGSGDKVKVFSGVIDKQVVALATILQLAQLPSREELLAKVVGSMSAPISGFVRVLNGPLQGFYNTVKALQSK
ncbi:50S ribosomal protein L10 [Patescibacteria group bacterium]|nr:50S ribosomal protein L10 [Patescibacteria group bacterium]